MTDSLHLDAFCQFWEMNFNSPVPPLPQQPSDLSITQLEQLRMYDGGRLYQNLFRITDPTKLPANLLRDEAKGIIDYQNKDLYRKFNYEHQAQRIEQAEAEYQQKKIDDEIEELASGLLSVVACVLLAVAISAVSWFSCRSGVLQRPAGWLSE